MRTIASGADSKVQSPRAAVIAELETLGRELDAAELDMLEHNDRSKTGREAGWAEAWREKERSISERRNAICRAAVSLSKLREDW